LEEIDELMAVNEFEDQEKAGEAEKEVGPKEQESLHHGDAGFPAGVVILGYAP
jgi:hypothetical protein